VFTLILQELKLENKEAIKQYWDNEPCGTRNIPYPIGSFPYFQAIENRRYKLDHITEKYNLIDYKGKHLLEVGCGIGTDLVQISRTGVHVTGMDISPKSVMMARENLRLFQCEGVVIEGDAENIPYKDCSFDVVKSWGVIHHLANPDKAISEIHRVLKPNGEVCVMLYHKPSLVVLQMWLAFGLFRLKPLRSIEDILANHHESLGTKAYTVKQVRDMFSEFKNLKIDLRATSYDLRYWRDKYFPSWMVKLVPRQLGWYVIVQGQKS